MDMPLKPYFRAISRYKLMAQLSALDPTIKAGKLPGPDYAKLFPPMDLVNFRGEVVCHAEIIILNQKGEGKARKHRIMVICPNLFCSKMVPFGRLHMHKCMSVIEKRDGKF